MLNDIDDKNEIKGVVKWNWFLQIALFEKPLWLSFGGLLDGVMGDVYT